jgi:hypothetical protein
MRLKDPLQGVKMAQGHIIIHVIFFILIAILPLLQSNYKPTTKSDIEATALQHILTNGENRHVQCLDAS